jgi:hypothetical protein
VFTGFTNAVGSTQDPYAAYIRWANDSACSPADGTVRSGSGTYRDEVSVEILFDPPGHARLPVNDDKIIDRAVTAQAFAGRPITILTYDPAIDPLGLDRLSQDWHQAEQGGQANHLVTPGCDCPSTRLRPPDTF